MNMQKEMCAANIKNWLMDLATGAKAAQKIVKYAPAKPEDEWRVTAKCYDNQENGVAIHDIVGIANAIDEPVKLKKFKPGDYFYDNESSYIGYYYIDMFGVRFFDLTTEGDVVDAGK